MCRCCLRSVAWFSYWFDNLGIITKGNTYRRCAASSLPLWGNTDVASSRIKRNFWRRCRGRSSTSTRFLITISSPCNLHYLPFASRFPLPHFTKICCFIRPLFRSPFSCRICFCVQSCLSLLSSWIVLPLLRALSRTRFSTLNKGEGTL